jgi:mannitol-specific phosphotransferase system IIBC component
MALGSAILAGVALRRKQWIEGYVGLFLAAAAVVLVVISDVVQAKNAAEQQQLRQTVSKVQPEQTARILTAIQRAGIRDALMDQGIENVVVYSLIGDTVSGGFAAMLRKPLPD